MKPGTTAPLPPGTIRAPRSPVTAEALPELGAIIIQANNPEDAALVEEIIKFIQKEFAGAEIQIEVVPLLYADATAVANIMAQMFQRVLITPTGNVGATNARPGAPAQQQAPQAQFAPGGQTGVLTIPAATAPSASGSVVLLPLPRFNAILLAAPRARLKDVVTYIKLLDQQNSAIGRSVPFPLKKA